MKDTDFIMEQVSETIEAFSAALYGLFWAALGWAMWPMIILAINAIAWVINELVRSN